MDSEVVTERYRKGRRGCVARVGMREEKRESTTVEMLCRLARDEERRGTGIVLMGDGGI